MSLDAEYTRWFFIQTTLLPFFVNGKNPKDRYEAENIFERWLLTSCNLFGIDNMFKKIDDATTDKMMNELVDKRLTAKWSIKNKRKEFCNLVVSFNPDNTTNQIDLETDDRNNFNYKRFKSTISTDNINYYTSLVNEEKCSSDQVTTMLLRYASMHGRGNQWSISKKTYDLLYEFGFKNEAFASPINSKLMGRDETNFCSLFKDTDEVFGSIGNFFEVDLSKYTEAWVVNPPFVESILTQTAHHILNYVSKHESTGDNGNEGLFLMIVPSWTDMKIYIELSNSKYVPVSFRLDKKSFLFEQPNGEPVPGGDSTVFLISSTLKKDDVADLMVDIEKAFKTV